MIEISELTKYYGTRKAVGPLSFTIDKGEVVGLLGLNGAGKTTTLRMLSSDLLPTSGQMLVDGLDLAEVPEKVQPRIGYLPDRPPLYGEMTVREFLVFAARLRGMKGRLEERVTEVIEMTDLGEYADEPIDTLSHGYRQRVGIAQAIVHKPALLLLDEPISGLDPVQIVEMRTLIRSLKGDHTIVLSSHILSEISETCDRLLVIRDGEIVASGSEQELSTQMAAAKSFRVAVRVPSGYRDTPFEGVRKLLEEIDGVQKVTRAEAPLGERGVVAAGVAATLDVRELAVKRLVEADFGVVGLERTGKELERVFLQLTGKEDAA
ncbi:MAG TPA: ABC transporter ATP-binding protein [Polyangiaceae bacterium]|nr:ABC transporter ATP-binding protein [Polyangiaceae bacterium]